MRERAQHGFPLLGLECSVLQIQPTCPGGSRRPPAHRPEFEQGRSRVACAATRRMRCSSARASSSVVRAQPLLRTDRGHDPHALGDVGGQPAERLRADGRGELVQRVEEEQEGPLCARRLEPFAEGAYEFVEVRRRFPCELVRNTYGTEQVLEERPDVRGLRRRADEAVYEGRARSIPRRVIGTASVVDCVCQQCDFPEPP